MTREPGIAEWLGLLSSYLYKPLSIQKFRREMGKYVDDAQVDFYEKYMFVPVDINGSDAETLEQIPGIDDVIADALMADRPFDSQEDFLDALSDHIGEESLAQAAQYLKE